MRFSSSRFSSESDASARAFSLIETLVVVGVLLLLSGIGVLCGRSCIEKARSIQEVAGARGTVSAWQAYANENNGEVITGYLSMGQASSGSPVRDAAGNPVTAMNKQRYPYRLANHLNAPLKGTLYVNKQASLVDTGNQYFISMAPSFGLNIALVGGDWGASFFATPPNAANIETYGQFAVTRLSQIHAPSRLLVFASARYREGSQNYEGYNAVLPPNFKEKMWSSAPYNEKQPDDAFGFIHPRYGGRAVCAMADGHVEMLTIDELRDMRRWSNQAAEADDPHWMLRAL